MILQKKLLVTVAGSLAIMALQASALTLKVADNHVTGHATVTALNEMADRVKERTNGEVELEIFSDGVLGDETDTVNQMRAGVVDMVRAFPGTLEKFDPSYKVFSMPFLFKDFDGMKTALNTEDAKKLFENSEKKGFKTLTWNTNGARSFYTKDKPIHKPEDLAGLKIRVPNSPSFVQTVEALGGAPTPLPLSEVYTAMQQGIIDGAEGSISALEEVKHGEVAKFYSYDRHLMVPDLLVIGTKTWKKLTPEQQAILEEEAQNYSDRANELFIAATEAAENSVKEKMGVEIIEVDPAPFKEKVKPLYDKAMKDKDIAPYLEAFQAAQQ
ncbi:MAG: TRAP transporter substrate-binding protein [Desulfopila sp.]